jgi:hypothetical protein
MLNVMYTECHKKPLMLGVIMLNVVKLNVMAPPVRYTLASQYQLGANTLAYFADKSFHEKSFATLTVGPRSPCARTIQHFTTLIVTVVL